MGSIQQWGSEIAVGFGIVERADAKVLVGVDQCGLERKAILFSSHNTLDVEQISDQITFIDRGRIIASDNKEMFLDRRRRLRLALLPDAVLPSLSGVVEVGGSGRLPVLVTNRFDPAMVSACNDAGATVQAVDPMTLEEIFVANVHSRREKQTV